MALETSGGSFLDELDDVFTEDELETLGQLEVSQASIDSALREAGDLELTDDYFEDEGIELRRRASSMGEGRTNEADEGTPRSLKVTVA